MMIYFHHQTKENGHEAPAVVIIMQAEEQRESEEINIQAQASGLVWVI